MPACCSSSLSSRAMLPLVRGRGPGSLHPYPARSYEQTLANSATPGATEDHVSELPGSPASRMTTGPPLPWHSRCPRRPSISINSPGAGLPLSADRESAHWRSRPAMRVTAKAEDSHRQTCFKVLFIGLLRRLGAGSRSPAGRVRAVGGTARGGEKPSRPRDRLRDHRMETCQEHSPVWPVLARVRTAQQGIRHDSDFVTPCDLG